MSTSWTARPLRTKVPEVSRWRTDRPATEGSTDDIPPPPVPLPVLPSCPRPSSSFHSFKHAPHPASPRHPPCIPRGVIYHIPYPLPKRLPLRSYHVNPAGSPRSLAWIYTNRTRTRTHLQTNPHLQNPRVADIVEDVGVETRWSFRVELEPYLGCAENADSGCGVDSKSGVNAIDPRGARRVDI